MRRRLGNGPVAAMTHFYVSTSLLIWLVVLFMTRYSFVSDHWQYFGSMSVIALAAAGFTMALDFAAPRTPFLKPALGGALLLVLGTLTWRQCGMYADIETLWRTTIARNPKAFMAHSNLGHMLLERGQVDAAVRHFNQAVELKPDFVEALNNLGIALKQTGQLEGAIAEFKKAVAVDPTLADSHFNLGNALLAAGRTDEAIGQFRQALEINPAFADARNNLGSAYKQAGRMDEAIDQFRQALKINPRFAGAWFNLGSVSLRTGRLEEAIDAFRQAVEINPNFADACNNLGLALLQSRRADEAAGWFQKTLGIQPDHLEAHVGLGMARLQNGRVDEAIVQFQQALEIEPRNIGVRNRLAWILATCPEDSLRNSARAVELAREADQLAGGDNPVILRTLAAAYANAGRFAEAMAAGERALQLARAQGNPALADDVQRQLGYYQAGFPFRDAGQLKAPARSGRP
jgi:protein O-mannosyl-transferase